MTLKRLTILSAAAIGLALNANADLLIVNGGFETGPNHLSGWTVAGTAGSDDAFFADNSTITPLNGFATVGPASGNWYAVSDQSGLVTPETTVLYQNITIPVGTTSAVLSLGMFVNDVFGGGGFGGEVAIWATSANPLTDAPLAVVFGPTDTPVSGGAPNPYVALSANIFGDVTAGQSYKIGILESDSTGPINVGVDNVSLVTTAVPEPSGLLLLGSLAASVVFIHRKVRA